MANSSFVSLPINQSTSAFGKALAGLELECEGVCTSQPTSTALGGLDLVPHRVPSTKNPGRATIEQLAPSPLRWLVVSGEPSWQSDAAIPVKGLVHVRFTGDKLPRRLLEGDRKCCGVVSPLDSLAGESNRLIGDIPS
jgi:hypothetical protein